MSSTTWPSPFGRFRRPTLYPTERRAQFVESTAYGLDLLPNCFTLPDTLPASPLAAPAGSASAPPFGSAVNATIRTIAAFIFLRDLPAARKRSAAPIVAR